MKGFVTRKFSPPNFVLLLEALGRRPTMPLAVLLFIIEPFQLGMGLPEVLGYVLDIPLASDQNSLKSPLPLKLVMTEEQQKIHDTLMRELFKNGKVPAVDPDRFKG